MTSANLSQPRILTTNMVRHGALKVDRDDKTGNSVQVVSDGQVDEQVLTAAHLGSPVTGVDDVRLRGFVRQMLSLDFSAEKNPRNALNEAIGNNLGANWHIPPLGLTFVGTQVAHVGACTSSDEGYQMLNINFCSIAKEQPEEEHGIVRRWSNSPLTPITLATGYKQWGGGVQHVLGMNGKIVPAPLWESITFNPRTAQVPCP